MERGAIVILEVEQHVRMPIGQVLEIAGDDVELGLRE